MVGRGINQKGEFHVIMGMGEMVTAAITVFDLLKARSISVIHHVMLSFGGILSRDVIMWRNVIM
jgi:hypothetical protein